MRITRKMCPSCRPRATESGHLVDCKDCLFCPIFIPHSPPLCAEHRVSCGFRVRLAHQVSQDASSEGQSIALDVQSDQIRRVPRGSCHLHCSSSREDGSAQRLQQFEPCLLLARRIAAILCSGFYIASPLQTTCRSSTHAHKISLRFHHVYASFKKKSSDPMLPVVLVSSACDSSHAPTDCMPGCQTGLQHYRLQCLSCLRAVHSTQLRRMRSHL